MENFWDELESRTKKYDLLCHPFYQAWTEGKLTREDLREYAADYYHHVAAFPAYLRELAGRLPEGGLRAAVVCNMEDELGISASEGRTHADLWMDFAQGMGAQSEEVLGREFLPEVRDLIAGFTAVAQGGSPAEALAAFYAYESQVPRVAREKARGLRRHYGADPATCRYFTLHATMDVEHARVWREQLNKLLAVSPELREEALAAGEVAARALWRALDGVESRRQARAA